MPTIILIIGILCLIGGFIFYLKAKDIKLQRLGEQASIDADISIAKVQQAEVLARLEELKRNKEDLNTEVKQLGLFRDNSIAKVDEELQNYKEYIAIQKEQLEKDYENKTNYLENVYIEKNETLSEEYKQKQEELDILRESLRAGAEAATRAREMKEKQEFYKLKVTERDLRDIKIINEFKMQLTNPVILSKLVWSQYFLNEASALCRRVLGDGKKCGIYKITNVDTEQCYIGQSVDIATRWKDHIKCGLGIEAPATNILYNNMQKDGVWNFTFELLEECPKDQLNAKEKQWIDFYNSAELGFNKTKGNN